MCWFSYLYDMHIYSIQGSCVWSCIAMTRTLWKPQGVEDTNFLYMDIIISKRGITLEPLCWTSQNKCHAHLLFINIMYINFHVDAFTTEIDVWDWKRQCKDDLSLVLAMSPRYLNRVGNTDFQNLTLRYMYYH